MKLITCHHCGLLATDTELFEYAAHQYIHARCALLRWNSDVVDVLTADQLEQFPVPLLDVLETIREHRRSETLRPLTKLTDLHAS